MDEPDEQTLKAVVKVQALFRGFIHRHNTSMLDVQNAAALKIQNCWKEYQLRKRVQRIKEIMALKKITRAVRLYKHRKKSKQIFSKLAEFDGLLQYYPSQSKNIPTESYTSKGKRAKGKGISKVITPKESETSKAREAISKKKKQMMEPFSPSASSARGGTKKKMKRKILMELPPPWHSKDPRRLSQSQRDEQLYEQKGTLAWAKSDLLPTLISRCNKMLDLCDELKARNDRYTKRIVQCPLIYATHRTTKPISIKSARQICVLPHCGVYVAASCTANAMLEISGFSEDKVGYKTNYQIDAPLFDVAIQPKNGQIVGLDSRWRLVTLELGAINLTRQLEKVPNKIPKASRFLFFDSSGLLWVNLYSQRGPLLCVDPLTLATTIQINFETINIQYRFFPQLITMIPVSLNNTPLGFVATFFEMSDVYIFNPEFSKFKKLRMPESSTIPIAKQIGNRLAIWTSENIVHVFTLNERFDLIIHQGEFQVNGNIVDVCYTEIPDLIYVACDDTTLHTYLGSSVEIPLRIPENKLTKEEARSALHILGPPKVTQSRRMFKEMRGARFTAVPMQIGAESYGEKTAIVFATLVNGSVCSLVVVNDSQSVVASEFEDIDNQEFMASHQTAVNDFNANFSMLQQKKAKYLEMMSFLEHFDAHAMSGQLKNLFYPGAQPFSFSEFVLSAKVQKLFPFIPRTEEKTISSYELFHFMKRAGILPDNICSFAQFLQRFAPQSMLKEIGEPSLTFNLRLPVNTVGIYGCVANLSFNKEDINNMIHSMNPLNSLRFSLKNFTLAGANEQKGEASTSRLWLSRYERLDLTSRVAKLTLLEDLVKHELMSRVQEQVNISFQSHLLDKMLPVPLIDMRLVPKEHENIIKFGPKPNRNPMLDGTQHKTVLDQWSKYTLFGRDREMKQILHALHIPVEIVKRQAVKEHIEIVHKVAFASKKISQCIHSTIEVPDKTIRIVVTEDSNSMPLSHFLTVHSFLGGDPRSLLVARSISSRALGILYQLHQKKIILRTFCPDNIFLSGSGSQVMVGTILDAQFPDREPLPLPIDFADPSNPFLPPEFFHEPPSNYTSAFDVWQFGIMLLYVITGFLPRSYGSELMEHLANNNLMESQSKIKIDEKDPLDPNPIYPRVRFFYDWLRGMKIVPQNTRCVGELGECFIQTDAPLKPATILDLEHYQLLPYGNTKLNYDETKIFLEIISCCLQIDPSKRPTAEELLRTYMFNQPAQAPDALEAYIRVPNPDVFVSQFFVPVISQLSEKTFPFIMGVIQALLFHEEDDEDDSEFAFPLDARANDRVVHSLFSMKFMDKIVEFMIRRIAKKVQLSDVIPAVTFQDDLMDQLVHFFMRFVSSVEHGQGPLVQYTDEVIMSLFALYTSNMYLRHSSNQFMMAPEDAAYNNIHDSVPVFLYTHSKVHGLLRYVLTTSGYVYNALKRTEEHNDWYFNQFLTFGDAVYNLAHTMCFAIDKQKGNAIKTITSMWSSGGNPAVIRLFLDYRVPQKVLHCLHLPGARQESFIFLVNVFRATQVKWFDPSYLLMQNCLRSPITLQHCANMMKSTAGNDTMRSQSLEIIKAILMFPSWTSTMDIVHSDILWNLFETLREPIIKQIVTDCIDKGSINLMKVVMASNHLQRMLSQNEIEIIPQISLHNVTVTLDIFETLELAKQLSVDLYLRQFPNVIERMTPNAPIKEAITFFPRAVQLVFREGESITKFMDTQALRAARFDLKETTFLKAKNKAKEQNIALTQIAIIELCDVLVELYRNIMYHIKNQKDPPVDFVKQVFELSLTPVPNCRTRAHPGARILQTFGEMMAYSLMRVHPGTSLGTSFMEASNTIPRIFYKEYSFLKAIATKGFVEQQLDGQYMREREIRFKLFKCAILSPVLTDRYPVLRFVVEDMLHSPLMLKVDLGSRLNAVMKFPVRFEAIEMVKFVLEHFERMPNVARELVDLISNDKFVDGERRLMQVDDNVQLIQSSIYIIELLFRTGLVTNDLFHKNASSFLISLKQQYTRAWDPSSVERETPDYPDPHAQTLSPGDMRARMMSSTAKRSTITSPKLKARARPATTFSKRSSGYK